MSHGRGVVFRVALRQPGESTAFLQVRFQFIDLLLLSSTDAARENRTDRVWTPRNGRRSPTVYSESWPEAGRLA